MNRTGLFHLSPTQIAFAWGPISFAMTMVRIIKDCRRGLHWFPLFCPLSSRANECERGEPGIKWQSSLIDWIAAVAMLPRNDNVDEVSYFKLYYLITLCHRERSVAIQK